MPRDAAPVLRAQSHHARDTFRTLAVAVHDFRLTDLERLAEHGIGAIAALPGSGHGRATRRAARLCELVWSVRGRDNHKQPFKTGATGPTVASESGTPRQRRLLRQTRMVGKWENAVLICNCCSFFASQVPVLRSAFSSAHCVLFALSVTG